MGNPRHEASMLDPLVIEERRKREEEQRRQQEEAGRRLEIQIDDGRGAYEIDDRRPPRVKKPNDPERGVAIIQFSPDENINK